MTGAELTSSKVTAAFLVIGIMTSQLTSALPALADNSLRQGDTGRLDLENLLHTHFGLSKRDTTRLLKAAERAPNTCLPNPEFQALMDTLIQNEMARLTKCSMERHLGRDQFNNMLP